MAQNLSLLSLFLLFSLLKPSLSQSSNPPTVYELLPKYGLPQGLLPATVSSYTLNDDGSFVVELPSTCYIQFDYLVYYDNTITGKLSYGAITHLKGIQVQRFLFWFDVDEIKVDLPPSDSIYFQVGLINKKLDVGQFKTVHSCRDDKLGYSGSGCGSWSRALKLPTPIADEVQMLITE
ncbi:uncharacterized protein LOC116139423 [Pistacia vera]|uniref:Uncharacterized protein n=1 Tax=Pistacia integerrima TaxID=434235 RepID=A0ACC0XSR1_9ROSI|nr:uncharacterized protein LOC116139423 [Pistacia vera]KAJ0021569.1 hypothetical protein Pint_31361 [Pistacia integerrima]